MASVEDRVVSMSFEGSKFESGVSRSLGILERLKSALHFNGATKGLQNVSNAAGRINFGPLGSAIGQVQAKFSTLQAAAAMVFANIATSALAAGANLVKSLTIAPVMGGLKEYELNLNSIQTILANTQASGAGLKDVEAALNNLNHYADKTIYNFAEMAKNIGTFTAAGVDLDTATASIKGIANLAALSGSNSQQASTAMYQLSQAISAGRVSLQDWNSVVNAGMGGTVFQRALAQTAEKMGTLDKGAVSLKGKMKNVSIEGKSFRESITARPGEQSWLTSEVLTKTLEQFTGDLSDAELAAQGFSKSQIAAIQAQAKTAVSAATEVKTLSGVMDTARESATSGWAQTWQVIFGDFDEAKKLFTGVSNALNGFIGENADARNAVLKEWKKLGGRDDLFAGLKNILMGIGSVLKPIKDGFRDIFPATTGKNLADITARFREFTENLKIGPGTAANLRRSFAGVFAIFSIGIQVLKAVGTVIATVFGALSKGSGSVLEFSGSLGDNIVALNDWLKEGDRLQNFAKKIGTFLTKPIELFGKLKDAISGIFEGMGGGGLNTLKTGLGDMALAATPMEKILDSLSQGWDGFLDILGRVKTALQPAVAAIGSAFEGIGEAISSSLGSLNFNQVLGAITTGLFGGLVMAIRGFLKRDLPGAGLLSGITEAFGSLTGSLTAMQNNLRAGTLQKIAVAIALLAGSLLVLSLIKPEKLSSALSAITIAFGQLLGAMALLTTISKSAGFLKVPFIAGAMILLASAILILSLAVRSLSDLSWEELAKGLAGTAVLLAAVAAAAGPLSKSSAGLVSAGVGIIAIGVAMKILASAVEDFGSMSWTEIGKGMASVAAALVAIGLASKLFPPGMVGIGVGLAVVAGALKILASVVGDLGKMDVGTIVQGLVGIGAALLILAGALTLMPPNMVATAAGLILVGVALKLIGSSLASFGGMSVGEIAKGLITLAGALLIITVAVAGMTGLAAGAGAMLIAAAAIMILAPALERMGNMSLWEIVKSMIALAGALVILGVAGALIAPVAPALLVLGLAVLAIGAGFALAGAGLLAMAAGLSALAIAGPAGLKMLVSAFMELISVVPKVAAGIVLGLIAIVRSIVAASPQFISAAVQLMGSLLKAVIAITPQVAKALIVMIREGLRVIRELIPDFVATGLALLIGLLDGISRNMELITTKVTEIVVKFVKVMATKQAQLVKAGLDLLGNVVKGMTQGLPGALKAGVNAVANLVKGVASRLASAVSSGAQSVASFISGVAGRIPGLVAQGARAVANFISGVASRVGAIAASAASAVARFVSSAISAARAMISAGAGAIRNFISGAGSQVAAGVGSIAGGLAGLGSDIVSGIVGGLTGAAGRLASAAASMARNALAAAKRALGSKSPSKEFMRLGDDVVNGFQIGIDSNKGGVEAATAMSNGIIDGVRSIFQISSPSKVMESLGKYVGEGFSKGLRGSQEDITKVFKEMQEKLTTAMKTARETIAKEEDKLDKLRKAKKRDTDAIKKAQELIDENQKLLDRSTKARDELTKVLSVEATKLKGLAKQFDDVSEALKEATSKLEDAVEARDNAAAGFADKYGELPDIDPEDKNPLATFTKGITDQTAAVTLYHNTLQQLRALGLSDRLYNKLLEDGTASQAFATQLLAGGATAVAGLNAIDAQLASASATLGTTAASNLYQAGVNAAQGIVDGLASKKAEIVSVMNTIADAMIKALKKKLKIKSPSRVLADVGDQMMAGWEKGIDDGAKKPKAAMEKSIAAIFDTMSTIPDAMDGLMDLDPVITPVLDLSQLEKDARAAVGILKTAPLSASASYGQASAILSENAATAAVATDAPAQVIKEIKLEQNNYSPKALSSVEIYRQTKNQLSLAKNLVDSKS